MDFENYKAGLDALEQAIKKTEDNESLLEFDGYKASLIRHLEEYRDYGGSDSGINRDYTNLNPLARKVTGKSFTDLCEEARKKPARVVDLGDPANFDLDEFIEECLEDLLQPSGLVGISVAISPESGRNFPTYLQNRLKAELAQVKEEEPFARWASLKPSYGSIDALVNSLESYKLQLDTSDVLLSVRADDEDRLVRFWNMLSKAFNSSFEYCLLVLIIKESEFSSPQAIKHNFPPPAFNRNHVFWWVKSLANQLTNEKDTKLKLINDWTEAIMRGCTQNQKLCTDRVYDHIAMCLGVLKRQNSIEALYQFLEKWEQVNAQTPS